MEIICKNCKHVFHGHYCNNCGQTAETHKINAHFLWHDIQHGLFHFDKGILYSFKQLFTRPGHSIREFIKGKRVKHFKPLSLVIITASVYGFLCHYFHINLYQNANNIGFDYSDFNEWTVTHYSWMTIAGIPLYTIGTWICFRKQGYNFVEYFILNSFKASQRLFAHIITFPLIYYFNGTPEINLVMRVLYAIDLILIFWTNIQFFNKLTKTKAFLLSVLSHIIFAFNVLLIAGIVMKILGIL